MKRATIAIHCIVYAAYCVILQPATAQDDLAAKAQNPIASMISLPIDTSVDFGANNGTAVISNVQPVIPVSIGDWNLVSRAITPVAWVEGAVGGLPSIPNLPPDPNQKSAFGPGEINYTGFLSPAKTDWLIWGVGPSLTFPTATDSILGAGKWSAGPGVLMLAQPKPRSLGVLVRPSAVNYPARMSTRRCSNISSTTTWTTAGN